LSLEKETVNLAPSEEPGSSSSSLYLTSDSFLGNNSTGVQWATLNPKWDATWSLLNVTDGMMLQILVKDKNKMMLDTDLGRASLILGAKLEGTQEHLVDIWQSDNRKQGKLIIQVSIQQPVTFRRVMVMMMMM